MTVYIIAYLDPYCLYIVKYMLQIGIIYMIPKGIKKFWRLFFPAKEDAFFMAAGF